MGPPVHVIRNPGFMPHLKRLLPSVKLFYFDNYKECMRDERVEVVLGEPEDIGPLLYSCPQMKWCMATWAGPDAIVKYCREQGRWPKAQVTRFGGIVSHMMAEWLIAQMVAYERRFDEIAINTAKFHWDQMSFVDYRGLHDLTIGILGFGDIGQTIAERCKAFGMTVLGVGKRERRPVEIPHFVDEYKTMSGLASVLERSDYVCSVLPDTPETTGLLDNNVLEVCQSKRPVYVNMGRPNIITEASIFHALEAGWIRHAILDVVSKEPLSPTSPLWRHPHITVSPHVSGSAQAIKTTKAFADNYQRLITGQPLHYLIDFEKGY